MSNRAYLSVWCRGVTPETLPEILAAFLRTIPFSRAKPGISHVLVRAVDSSETPVVERDLRTAPVDPDGTLEVIREWFQADCGAELAAQWDLWVLDEATGTWTEKPQPLVILCNGPDFDAEAWRLDGHFHVELGFEHLFTGHAGLLGTEERATPQHPAEAQFLLRMQRPEALREYATRTRENIRRLQAWAERINRELPVERFVLGSEGEEDFEGRLEAIVAAQ